MMPNDIYLGNDEWIWRKEATFTKSKNTLYTIMYTVMKMKKNGESEDTIAWCIEYGIEALLLLKNVLRIDFSRLNEEKMRCYASYISQSAKINEWC